MVSSSFIAQLTKKESIKDLACGSYFLISGHVGTNVMFFISSMYCTIIVVCPYHWLRRPHFLKSLHLFLLYGTASHLPQTWPAEH